MNLLHALHHGGWLRHVDLSLAKSMSRVRADTPDWVLAAAALASRALANGHSQLPLAQVEDLLLEISSENLAPDLPPLDAWRQMLEHSPWVSDAGVLVLEDSALSLRRYWQYERRLAQAITARLASAARTCLPLSDARMRQLFGPERNTPAELAARAALRLPLLLLTGGPGTGKTTAVTRTLVLFAEQFAVGAPGRRPRIALAAPTGKAAARLAESVRENLEQLTADGAVDAELAHALPTEASTLHRLLGWQRGTINFRHNAQAPLPVDLVIVDEASMIDLPLMCKLFEAMPADASLLLIGDRHQLPSVETGDVLAALCDAATQPEGALAAHRVHLVHSHRQREDRDIAALADLLRDGDSSAAIGGLDRQAFRGVAWQQGNDRALADAVLAQALPAYRALLAAADVSTALRMARNFRVLTAVREGAAGSQTLNAIIATALDPARRGEGFFSGRLVLVNENSYRHQLFNGDIGIVWPDEHGELRVWFDAEDGPRAWLPAALPGHESAFALTVHKAQGSEFESVFLALPEHGARVISRELLYTGLTRCRREVTLWASEAVLRAAIERKAQRWSGLAARLGVSPPSIEGIELGFRQRNE